MKSHRLVEQTVTVAVDSWTCDRCDAQADSNEDDPSREGMPLGWWELIRRNPMNGTIERRHHCPECVEKAA